jgi:NAD(P)-dependent dehydrogenase (short-subunit alcohol dehydrogenase family)
VVLVTGAAGDIGRSLCAQLAERGCLVAAWDLADRPKEHTAGHWEVLDLTSDVPAVAVSALDNLGRLSYVFHVVGGSDVEELREPDPAQVSLEVFQRTVALNLMSAYVVVRATIGLLRRTDGDRSFTFATSTNALGGYGAPGYSAAKAGVHGLTAALSVPLGREGIRVNAVALGTTRTANYENLGAKLGRRTDFERLGTLFPRGSVLAPGEAAAALISVGFDNPAVSGQVVVADAAQHLLRPSPRRTDADA